MVLINQWDGEHRTVRGLLDGGASFRSKRQPWVGKEIRRRHWLPLVHGEPHDTSPAREAHVMAEIGPNIAGGCDDGELARYRLQPQQGGGKRPKQVPDTVHDVLAHLVGD